MVVRCLLIALLTVYSSTVAVAYQSGSPAVSNLASVSSDPYDAPGSFSHEPDTSQLPDMQGENITEDSQNGAHGNLSTSLANGIPTTPPSAVSSEAQPYILEETENDLHVQDTNMSTLSNILEFSTENPDVSVLPYTENLHSSVSSTSATALRSDTTSSTTPSPSAMIPELPISEEASLSTNESLNDSLILSGAVDPTEAGTKLPSTETSLSNPSHDSSFNVTSVNASTETALLDHGVTENSSDISGPSEDRNAVTTELSEPSSTSHPLSSSSETPKSIDHFETAASTEETIARSTESNSTNSVNTPIKDYVPSVADIKSATKDHNDNPIGHTEKAYYPQSMTFRTDSSTSPLPSMEITSVSPPEDIPPQPSPYNWYLLILNGNCSSVMRRERRFEVYVRANLAEKVSVEFSDVLVTSVTCNSVLFVNVTVFGENQDCINRTMFELANSHALLVEFSGQMYNLTTVRTKKSLFGRKTYRPLKSYHDVSVEVMIYLAIGAVCLFIIFSAILLSITLCYRKSKKAKRDYSKPNSPWYVPIENYTMTKIPRPKGTYGDTANNRTQRPNLFQAQKLARYSDSSSVPLTSEDLVHMNPEDKRNSTLSNRSSNHQDIYRPPKTSSPLPKKSVEFAPIDDHIEPDDKLTPLNNQNKWGSLDGYDNFSYASL